MPPELTFRRTHTDTCTTTCSPSSSTAGSSGTRIYVHAWTPGNALGTIRELTRRKLKPGLSAYVNSLDSVDEALAGLLDHAALFVPAESRAATSVFLKATAGLRLLTPTGRAAVLDRARDVLAGKEGRKEGSEEGRRGRRDLEVVSPGRVW